MFRKTKDLIWIFIIIVLFISAGINSCRMSERANRIQREWQEARDTI